MISPLGSKWSLGTNENKDRAQYLQVLKPKTSKHSDCTYSRIWQCQINLHGSYASQQCNWQTSKLTAEFFSFHSVFLKSSVFNLNTRINGVTSFWSLSQLSIGSVLVIKELQHMIIECNKINFRTNWNFDQFSDVINHSPAI